MSDVSDDMDRSCLDGGYHLKILYKAHAFKGLARDVGDKREPAVQMNPLEGPHGHDSFDSAD